MPEIALNSLTQRSNLLTRSTAERPVDNWPLPRRHRQHTVVLALATPLAMLALRAARGSAPLRGRLRRGFACRCARRCSGSVGSGGMSGFSSLQGNDRARGATRERPTSAQKESFEALHDPPTLKSGMSRPLLKSVFGVPVMETMRHVGFGQARVAGRTSAGRRGGRRATVGVGFSP